MPRIVISTQNFMFADMIRRTLESDDFSVTVVEKPEKLMQEFNRTAANIVLMEVTGYTPWTLEERLRIRDEVRRQNPHCKIVLVVDENTDKRLADQVRQTKKDGLIDNFIYGSVSAAYLSAVIDTL